MLQVGRMYCAVRVELNVGLEVGLVQPTAGRAKGGGGGRDAVEARMRVCICADVYFATGAAPVRATDK